MSHSYFLDDCFHRLEILDLGPAFYQIYTDLIDCILNGSVLRTVWRMANNTVSALPHCLVNLRRTVRVEVVVAECSAKSRILNCVISVEHMLNKQAVSHCQCPGRHGYSCPNARVNHQADIVFWNIRIARLHCTPIIVPQLANLQSLERGAIFPVPCIEM